MSIDPKFVELMADVLKIFFIKYTRENTAVLDYLPIRKHDIEAAPPVFRVAIPGFQKSLELVNPFQKGSSKRVTVPFIYPGTRKVTNPFNPFYLFQKGYNLLWTPSTRTFCEPIPHEPFVNPFYKVYNLL